jgi:phosphonate degradation associated HDIG domain protein
MTIRLSSLEEIDRLYAERGGLSYGEGVSQVEHAVQCAALAQAQGCAPSLVLAALLHDIGHLFVGESTATQTDAHHEAAGAQALAGLFGEAVCAPIALHVAAKRWLCRKEPEYLETLSAASRRSLELQGGPFSASAAAAFERAAYWREAVTLRRFDDAGKREDVAGRAFADFAPLLRVMRLDSGQRD